MPALQHEAVHAMAPERFASVLSRGEYYALLGVVSQAARELHGRVIWNVNSTAKGSGVVEMLRPLLGYCRGAGVDARWAVISGHLVRRVGRLLDSLAQAPSHLDVGLCPVRIPQAQSGSSCSSAVAGSLAMPWAKFASVWVGSAGCLCSGFWARASAASRRGA